MAYHNHVLIPKLKVDKFTTIIYYNEASKLQIT